MIRWAPLAKNVDLKTMSVMHLGITGVYGNRKINEYTQESS